MTSAVCVASFEIHSWLNKMDFFRFSAVTVLPIPGALVYGDLDDSANA
jgi:hypothetical protein